MEEFNKVKVVYLFVVIEFKSIICNLKELLIIE